MIEIGSEFWDIPISKNENYYFSDSIQWYLSGRCALKSIIKRLDNCHTVAMPSWCCDSMVKPFIDNGFVVKFYPVYFSHSLIQEHRFDCDVLFLIDYFGYCAPNIDVSEYRGVIIRDTTHSMFSHTYNDADYYFGSLRKWCGFYTGGYAWTRDGTKLIEAPNSNNRYVSIREMAMHKKQVYIEGHNTNSMISADKSYLSDFSVAEECLDNSNYAMAALRDMLLVPYLDINYIKSRRNNNASIIQEELQDYLVFNNQKVTDCPMFVPILVPDGKRDSLKKYLIERSIYCPVHWPISHYHNLDQRERYIYDNELSLVCDQRYDESDMDRLVETIKRFFREG